MRLVVLSVDQESWFIFFGDAFKIKASFTGDFHEPAGTRPF